MPGNDLVHVGSVQHEQQGTKNGPLRYADDLLLVLASIHKLQLMAEIYCSEGAKLDMKFNASKSQAIRIGKSRRTDICHITLVVVLYVLSMNLST